MSDTPTPTFFQRMRRLLDRLLAPFRKSPPPPEKKRVIVLLDYENVQPSPQSIACLREADNVRIFIFANAYGVSLPLVSALQPLGAKVEYVQTSQTGKNALDFHIACALGLLANTAPPDCHIFVVSADRGYDSMIGWINRITTLRVKRVNTFGLLGRQIAILNPPAHPIPADMRHPADDFFHLVLSNRRRSESAPDGENADTAQKAAQPPVAAVSRAKVERLEKNLLKCDPRSRPRSIQALRNHIASHFSAKEADGLMDAILQRGSITLEDDGRLHYFLSQPQQDAAGDDPPKG